MVNNTIICCESFAKVTYGPNCEMKGHMWVQIGMMNYFLLLEPTQMHIYKSAMIVFVLSNPLCSHVNLSTCG